MKRKRLLLPILIAATLLAIVAYASLQARNAATTAASTFMTTYPIPISGGKPTNIIVETPGRTWFTLPGSHQIGSLVVTSTLNYTFTFYNPPTNNSEPYDLALKDQFIWFTEKSGNNIGRLEISTGIITEYSIPTSNSGPTGIAAASDGKIWFVEQYANQLASFDPQTSAFVEYPYSVPNGQLEDIAIASPISIWMTAPGANQVSEFQVDEQKYIDVPVVDFGIPPHPPSHILIDGSSAPWITAPTQDLIGRYRPGTLAFWRWYSGSQTGGYPTGLAYAFLNGFNNIWFVERDSGKAGYLAVDSNGKKIFLREHLLPTQNSRPEGIAVDGNGRLWISDSNNNEIVEWIPPYFWQLYLPVINT